MLRRNKTAQAGALPRTGQRVQQVELPPEEKDLLGKVAAMSDSGREAVQRIVAGANHVVGAPGTAGPGFYYDPASGKTYRVRRPMKHSAVYNQAAGLEKAALSSMRKFVGDHELVYDPKSKTITMKDGKTLNSELVAQHKKLLGDLEHAKKQFKLVRETERSGKSGKGGSTLDPSKRPTIKKDADGKVSWADM
jgi:hypothetical protein